MLEYVLCDVILIRLGQRNTLVVEPSTESVCSTNITTNGVLRKPPLLQSAQEAWQIRSEWSRLQANEHIRPPKITFDHLTLLLLHPRWLGRNIPSRPALHR